VPTNERRLTGLAYACLLIVGIHAGWIGPFLSEISRMLTLSIDRAGLVVSAASAGYFVALIVAGGVSHRWSAQKILVVAMALLGAGMFGLARAAGLPALLCTGVLLGLGNGSIDVAANALIVDLNRDRLAAALNYLHVLFGVGAMIGPMVASFALAHLIPYWWVFSAGAAASSMVAIGLATTAAVEVRVPAAPGDGFVALLERPLIWVIGGVLFLYVGAEMGIGAWLTLYLHAAAALSATVASAGVSLYWLGLVLGRIVGGRLAHRIAPRELSILASVLSAIALIGLIAAPTSHLLAALMVLLIGFGYGPIFPNMVAVGAARFPAQVGKVSSIVIAGGALGGVFVPWVMGHAMATATPRSSMEIALAVSALMALLSFAVRGSDAPTV
jgi:MFS transporter, FHS family, glucose/mannose:H+ symporter